MMLLQLTSLKAYDQIPIVVGMIICVALQGAVMFLYHKYLSNLKIEITGVRALEITTEMIDKIMKFPIDGHSVERRASKLHHDTTQALETSNNITSVLIELSDGQKEFIKMVSKAYEQQAKRDEDHHKDIMKMQDEHNKQLIDFLLRNNKNKIN